MTGVLKKANLETGTHTGRILCEDEGRHWGWHFYMPKNAKECQQSIRSYGGDMGQILPHTISKSSPCRHFDLRLLAYRIVRHFPLLLPYSVCGNLMW